MRVPARSFTAAIICHLEVETGGLGQGKVRHSASLEVICWGADSLYMPAARLWCCKNFFSTRCATIQQNSVIYCQIMYINTVYVMFPPEDKDMLRTCFE